MAVNEKVLINVHQELGDRETMETKVEMERLRQKDSWMERETETGRNPLLPTSRDYLGLPPLCTCPSSEPCLRLEIP